MPNEVKLKKEFCMQFWNDHNTLDISKVKKKKKKMEQFTAIFSQLKPCRIP